MLYETGIEYNDLNQGGLDKVNCVYAKTEKEIFQLLNEPDQGRNYVRCYEGDITWEWDFRYKVWKTIINKENK